MSPSTQTTQDPADGRRPDGSYPEPKWAGNWWVVRKRGLQNGFQITGANGGNELSFIADGCRPIIQHIVEGGDRWYPVPPIPGLDSPALPDREELDRAATQWRWETNAFKGSACASYANVALALYDALSPAASPEGRDAPAGFNGEDGRADRDWPNTTAMKVVDDLRDAGHHFAHRSGAVRRVAEVLHSEASALRQQVEAAERERDEQQVAIESYRRRLRRAEAECERLSARRSPVVLPALPKERPDKEGWWLVRRSSGQWWAFRWGNVCHTNPDVRPGDQWYCLDDLFPALPSSPPPSADSADADALCHTILVHQDA